MMTDGFLTLPLEVQVALGGGYLAYAVAFAGIRKSESAAEMAFRSLAFGLAALLALRFFLANGWPTSVSVGAALCSAVFLGAFWRRWGKKYTWKILRALKISGEDGMPDAWTATIQTPGLNITQLTVHTTDGRQLQHDRAAYKNALHDGLYLGSDGGIILVVSEEEYPDGHVEKREGIEVEDWGTRLTYIPPSQIKRVDIRTNTTS